MTAAVPPALSVVLATPYGFETLRPVLGYLAEQTVQDRIEVVLVGTTPEGLEVDEGGLEGFHSHQVLHVGPIEALSVPRAAGIRAARAPVVALTEDHCFPEPTWAAALLSAHEGPWAAVGPTVGIANPQRYRTWANHLIQYGPWVYPTPSGEQKDVAGHNSSYKRSILMERGDELEALFSFDARLHSLLRRAGHSLYVEAGAISHHVYMTKLAPFVREHFHIGRAFAATRASDWSPGRRAFYALASPALPVLRTGRIFARMRSLDWFGELVPGLLPSLWLGLAASALGEMTGYATGTLGRSARITVDLDFQRHRFVSERERAAIWGHGNVVFTAQPPRLKRRRRRD